jgi:hypothetical protein
MLARAMAIGVWMGQGCGCVTGPSTQREPEGAEAIAAATPLPSRALPTLYGFGAIGDPHEQTAGDIILTGPEDAGKGRVVVEEPVAPYTL